MLAEGGLARGMARGMVRGMAWGMTGEDAHRRGMTGEDGAGWATVRASGGWRAWTVVDGRGRAIDGRWRGDGGAMAGRRQRHPVSHFRGMISNHFFIFFSLFHSLSVFISFPGRV